MKAPTILYALLAFAAASVASAQVKHRLPGSPFIVTFPEAPTVSEKTGMKTFLGLRLDVQSADVATVGGFMRADFPRNLDSAALRRMTNVEIDVMMNQFAIDNGLEPYDLEVKIQEGGGLKIAKHLVYKRVKGRKATYELRTYIFGGSALFTMTGAPEGSYPTPEIEKFLKAISVEVKKASP